MKLSLGLFGMVYIQNLFDVIKELLSLVILKMVVFEAGRRPSEYVTL